MISVTSVAVLTLGAVLLTVFTIQEVKQDGASEINNGAFARQVFNVVECFETGYVRVTV
ncbi:hypothetical protein PI124_g19390 [Phytophthora idaei]|nr:hypothetical protein PI125_g23154 [Phytophthora idaei]KAG3154882.1 hypothetical protein PI126_g9407 [Phytophthora idaei]KAG3235578.1 hypothetical protein PI124_g19390 [Phytophthora idaei]